MNGVNPVIMAMYGTGPTEEMNKLAQTEDGYEIRTHEDLATAYVLELGLAPEDADMQKVAAVRDAISERFSEYDLAGRAMAHSAITEMEKAAAEGNYQALDTFLFGDSEAAPPANVYQAAREAVLAELQRRNQAGG